MNIGAAAKTSGVSAKMIRYYERIGLIRVASRTQSGYRMWSDRDVHTLKFIRSARSLGFSVNDIRELLALWQKNARQSVDVKRIALDHIASLQQKISELAAMVGTLNTLINSCAGDERPDCPILADLETGTAFHVVPSARRFGEPGEHT